MNASERLTALSSLSGVSAAAHLIEIAGFSGVAGVLLVAYSRLLTGTAAQHLLADPAPSVPDLPADQFNYRAHMLQTGRYRGDPVIGRLAQRMRNTRRR